MKRFLGMELVATANMLRRITFHDEWEPDRSKLTTTQHWFLSFLWEHADSGDIFQKDLEANFKIRGSTATEILKTMERKGLITRQPVPSDRRAKRILLTEEAVRLCTQNKQTILTMEERLARGFTQEELRTFFQLMDKLKVNIEAAENGEQ